MADMLVKLYELPEEINGVRDLRDNGVLIKQALAPDKSRVLEYVKNNFSQSWVNECDCAFSNHPVSCYIAVKDKEIIGFACYDVTAKNFFGPTGVSEEYRGVGVGKVLLLKALSTMREQGYGYAIIGGVNSAKGFYQKVVGATVIEDSAPGIYRRMIDRE